ncbi:hypothetical protein NHG24_02790 [Aerococcaceae bacterium NML210727]|nr:hypothetical protein [Aerococcaceae bacterium NML210727]MCW6655131.1 hypothetical protein [Aerococcaceae bacterium NML201296]
MVKKPLTDEQKRLDIDLWVIVLFTLGAFGLYMLMRQQFMSFVIDSSISVMLRLFLNAALQFGVAGLGITIVSILRRERFTKFGLSLKNVVPAIFGTIICFIPLVAQMVASGKFRGYQPFQTVVVSKDVLSSGVLISVLGMGLIVVVWGFFEGFNYVVIADKINRRYPSTNDWLDYGAITCSVFCLLSHPFNISFRGVTKLLATFIAIYGMLIVKKRTGNAWGCIFAFCFIWNAL